MKIEGLYLPLPQVGTICRDLDPKLATALLEGTNIHDELKETLIRDKRIRWAIERWPIALTRMTGIYSDNNDPMGVRFLMEKANKRFEQFAQLLMRRPDILKNYPKFDIDRWESHMPAVGLRGKLGNHVVDGHHRITRGVWRGETHATIMTAYKPFSISRS